MSHLTRIDWFSWTEANDAPLFEVEVQLEGLSRDFYRQWIGYWGTALPSLHEWVAVKPNNPYRRAIQCPEHGFRMEWGGGANTILIMCPGKACAHLAELGRLNDLVYRKANHCTRIDFAVDMLCTTKPAEFVNARTSKKHKNIAFHQSDEGETCYVGSWSSDRFARVYRYNPPHERANWLRAEHVFKGKQAKAFAHQVNIATADGAVAFVGDIYGWGHKVWVQPPTTLEEKALFKAWIPERHASKTLKWLEEVCIASIVRLWNEGEIENPYEWFAQRMELALTPSTDKIEIPTTTPGG